MNAFRARYGASAVHLLLVLCSFALAGYAGVRLLQGDTLGVALWFVGAALLHDLVLLPLYTLTDRLLQLLLRGGPKAARRPGGTVAERINYLRVPVFVSLLLLVVWYPLILNRVPGYTRYTALPAGVFWSRWLLLTAGLFALSALCLLAAVWRTHRSRPRSADDSP
ncbi:hypothetical protein [Streptomyces kronopolitis]|uniref:hypothetical protein n=1 Tax=Streptomyces kronopolitis TaxID=1612435 RepID=UPI0020BF1732|nr:hypothetical protein [Streptomyces kronopolitis]MCL6297833.1 hypothetical protein [Streptomyces kronopolitis]